MRKKKTLLKETTIRRFMKLANMEPLQENYFDQYGLEEQEEEELEMGAEEEVEAPMGDELGGEEEIEVEDEIELGGDEGGDVDEAAVKDLVDTIATAIEDKYDIPISVEGGDAEAGGEEELEMGAEEEIELPPEGGEPGMEGGEEEVEMGAEEELMELLNDAGIEVIDDGPMVHEVVRRVAKRLIREKMGVRKQAKRSQRRR